MGTHGHESVGDTDGYEKQIDNSAKKQNYLVKFSL